MLRRLKAFFVVALLIGAQLPAFPASAQLQLDPGFDPNRVLEDNDVFDVSGMSYARLVEFLRVKGTLADVRLADIDGIPKTGAEIIWRVATSYKINPKYLLALIQKEQSLVEDPSPTSAQFDWAAGYAICDSCSKNDPSVQEFKGFASQLEWAAKQHREKYLLQLLGSGQTRAGKGVGKTMTVDGLTITPTNKATAMLYSYTPHLHGNLNLWNIWRRWFSLKYPDGTVVRGKSSGKAYLIQLGQKRPFASKAVLMSLVDPDRVVDVSETELSAYPDGSEILFSKYSLLSDSKHRVWLLTEDARRLIQDMKAFHKFGFNEDEIEDVDDADLEGYPIGSPITVKTEFPQGVVMQEKETKKYWYVEDGTKQPIPDKTFLALYFKGRNIKSATTKKLATYKTGEPYRFHDGELVRGKKASSVYVMENGNLRPIPSAQAFEAFGWKWRNVVTVPDAVLTGYTVGDAIAPLSVMQTASVASSTLSAL